MTARPPRSPRFLSPCILLTHNRKDFAALGVHTSRGRASTP